IAGIERSALGAARLPFHMAKCFGSGRRRLAQGRPRAYALPPAPMGAQFLAFDLGAESGRAMLGRLRAGVLDLAEVCRFPNEPVRQNGSLHWDVLRLW